MSEENGNGAAPLPDPIIEGLRTAQENLSAQVVSLQSALRSAEEGALAQLRAAGGTDAEMRAAENSILLERVRWMRQVGITFGGARDLYQVLGYTREITTTMYRQRYQRGGVAGRIIDALPNATWRGSMRVAEDKDAKTNTKFEQSWEDLDRRLQVQAKLLRVDKLSRLSTYAVLLLGEASGEDFSQPLPKGTPEKLIYLTPFLGGGGPGGDYRNRAIAADVDASIQSFVVNPKDPRFGQPEFYQLRRVDISSPSLNRRVHWSRIIHIAENVLDDEVYGLPALERVWNLLDDLDKVTGGGAEAFWLRANQGLHLNIDKDMSVPDTQKSIDALKDQSEDYKHQLTRWLRTRGVDAKTLGSDVANFANPADAILTQIAGSTAIPKRILTGSEMGELASSQDRENWKDQVNGRQVQHAGPYIVRRLVDRLIEYGYLPKPSGGADKYDVVWPQLQVLTEDEKAQGAKNWATTTNAGKPVFTTTEIRDKWYGMPKLTAAQMKEIEPPAPEAPAEETPTEVPAPKKLLKAAGERKYSSTEVVIPKRIGGKLLEFGRKIPDAELAIDGREDKPHVTVKYGVLAQDPDGVREAIADFVGPIKVTLGKTKAFKSKDHDVLYAEVKSPDLKRLNAIISNRVEVVDTHPRYKPHATIAYLKPGEADKYVDDDTLEGQTFDASVVVFSPAEGDRTDLPLGLRAAQERETLLVLQAAIEAGNADVIESITGIRTAVPA